MCYHCATNPSIHHHCRCVAAVSLLLSHHGVTFTVTLSRFCHCHCDVAFIIALLRCHCRSCVVAVPSLSHCHGFVVAVIVTHGLLVHFLVLCGDRTAYCMDMGSCKCGLPFLEPFEFPLVSMRTSDGGVSIR